MEKKELILKMKEELQNYQIGLHNIRVDNYNTWVERGIPEDKKEIVELSGAVVSEKAIAENILTKGFCVMNPLGLRATTTPLKELDDTALDYDYYGGRRENQNWNVIVAVPRFLRYEGTDYFLGDYNYVLTVANYYLFKPLLFSEFVYGYYVIDSVKDSEKLTRSTFSQEVDFFPNPNFIEKLDDDKKELFLNELWVKKDKLLEYLELVHSNSCLLLKMRPSNIFDRGAIIRAKNMRAVISETRKQRKRLFYGKK